MKTGNEHLTNGGFELAHSILDFWRWQSSNILSNATRGAFAEFIVATAVGINAGDVREEWRSQDLITADDIKIEVKSAAFIQSWHQNAFSRISFSIKAARAWDNLSQKYSEGKIRSADLYVFCHLKHKDRSTINPLEMSQWDFYVLPTSKLNQFAETQASIGLRMLQSLAKPVVYADLRPEILRAYELQKEQMGRS